MPAHFPGQFVSDLTEGAYVARMLDILGEAGVTPARIAGYVSRYLTRAGLPGATVRRVGRTFTVTLPDGTLRHTAPARRQRSR